MANYSIQVQWLIQGRFVWFVRTPFVFSTNEIRVNWIANSLALLYIDMCSPGGMCAPEQISLAYLGTLASVIYVSRG